GRDAGDFLCGVGRVDLLPTASLARRGYQNEENRQRGGLLACRSIAKLAGLPSVTHYIAGRSSPPPNWKTAYAARDQRKLFIGKVTDLALLIARRSIECAMRFNLPFVWCTRTSPVGR